MVQEDFTIRVKQCAAGKLFLFLDFLFGKTPDKYWSTVPDDL